MQYKHLGLDPKKLQRKLESVCFTTAADYTFALTLNSQLQYKSLPRPNLEAAQQVRV